MTATTAETVTVSAPCETGQHAKCKGQVRSIATGDRPCECPDCHNYTEVCPCPS